MKAPIYQCVGRLLPRRAKVKPPMYAWGHPSWCNVLKRYEATAAWSVHEVVIEMGDITKNVLQRYAHIWMYLPHPGTYEVFEVLDALSVKYLNHSLPLWSDQTWLLGYISQVWWQLKIRHHDIYSIFCNNPTNDKRGTAFQVLKYKSTSKQRDRGIRAQVGILTWWR